MSARKRKKTIRGFHVRRSGKKKLIVAAAALAALGLVVFLAVWKERPQRGRAHPPAVRKEAAVYTAEPAERAPAALPSKKPLRIAIVIDDFGYNDNNADEFLSIGQPLTFSILPNLPYTNTIARKARLRGAEVILHLPLESVNQNAGMEKDTITTAMTDDEIRRILANAVESVPGLVGVSNHMGSKATADGRVMDVIMGALKKKGLFYLDSRSTGSSVCARAARGAGCRFAARDVFLDNENDPEYIKGEIEKLEKKAEQNGYAIAICHDRRTTAAVMKEMLPRLAARGFKFVYVSDLVER